MTVEVNQFVDFHQFW